MTHTPVKLTKNFNAEQLAILETVPRLPHFAYYEPAIKPEEAIEQIRVVPDLLMEKALGIKLDYSPGDPEGILLDSARKMYLAVAKWLELDQTNDSGLRQELRHTSAWHYKPIYEKAVATRELAKEISLYTKWQHSELLDPLHWWLSVEQELCEQLLSSSGYLGKPLLLGKAQNYKETVKRDKALAKPTLDVVSVRDLSPIQAVEGIAWLIAQHDPRWQYFNQYRRTLKRCDRKLRDGPLSTIYLHNGEVQRYGRGKKKSNL